MIFKSSAAQAHGRVNTFVPGFGCTILDAVCASCAAFPYFNRVKVITANQEEPELIDGGFVANNPTLLAIADGVNAYKVPKDKIKVLSLGTGIYTEPKRSWLKRVVFRFEVARLIPKMLEANTNTVEQIRLILFPDVVCVRINGEYPQKEFETDMFESSIGKLRKLKALGREDFAEHERILKSIFIWS